MHIGEVQRLGVLPRPADFRELTRGVEQPARGRELNVVLHAAVEQLGLVGGFEEEVVNDQGEEDAVDEVRKFVREGHYKMTCGFR